MTKKIRPASVEAGEQLQLVYVKVKDLKQWDRNPKKHDLPSIKKSIMQHGFKDPPKWSNLLDGLVEGNGRFEALTELEAEGGELPRGILKAKDGGEWCAPILMGVEAKSKEAAMAYAIDHNNLVLAGSAFTDLIIADLWEDDYAQILKELDEAGETFASITPAALREIEAVIGPSKEFFDPNDLPDLKVPEGVGDQERSFLLYIGFKDWEDMRRAVLALSRGDRKISPDHKTISLNVYTGSDKEDQMKYIDDWEGMSDG